MPSEISEIEQSLQRMWDENGDKLSNQYAGTQSNISGVLEDGKQSFAGGIFGKLKTGVQRYFVSNFSDPEKQASIDIMMGQHPDQKLYGARRMLHEFLKTQLQTYMETRQIRIGVLTWNCAGNPPPQHLAKEIKQVVLPRPNELKPEALSSQQ